MTRKTVLFLLLIAILTSVLSAGAVDIDPILIDAPNFLVQECSENLFFEVLVDPIIEYTTGDRNAKDLFFFFTAELLFLEEEPWTGIDKGSFVLQHTAADGTVESYPLNYMMTMMLSLKNGWRTLTDQISFGDLITMTLVFDVQTLDTKNWSLLLQPGPRGDEPFCSVEIPLRVQP